LKEWIRGSLLSDCGFGAVPGNDGDLVGQSEKSVVDGGQKLANVPAGEVRAAYGACEEGVSGEEEGLGGEVEADAAFGVAGGVEDGTGDAGDGDELAVLEGVVWG
jgi:hypothetical protein